MRPKQQHELTSCYSIEHTLYSRSCHCRFVSLSEGKNLPSKKRGISLGVMLNRVQWFTTISQCTFVHKFVTASETSAPRIPKNTSNLPVSYFILISKNIQWRCEFTRNLLHQSAERSKKQNNYFQEVLN